MSVKDMIKAGIIGGIAWNVAILIGKRLVIKFTELLFIKSEWFRKYAHENNISVYYQLKHNCHL